jgi:hypothetical protein
MNSMIFLNFILTVAGTILLSFSLGFKTSLGIGLLVLALLPWKE